MRNQWDKPDFPPLSEWLGWPAAKVADLVSKGPSPLVVAWPYEGTRRWYLSYRDNSHDRNDYLLALTRRQAEVSRMIFDHGAHALLIPLFGTALLDRGPEYASYGLNGLRLLGEDAAFREMYAAGVRLRFYGDYARELEKLGLPDLVAFCEELQRATATNRGPLLLIGLFAENPYDSIASYSVGFAREHDRAPDRQELIEAYYGVRVPDLSLYVNYAQHAMFDVPLIASGREDLYATLNPSPAMTERQFREILYDHLFTRRAAETEYGNLSPEGRAALASYVRLYDGLSLGVGRIDPLTQTWVPSLPDDPLPGGQA